MSATGLCFGAKRVGRMLQLHRQGSLYKTTMREVLFSFAVPNTSRRTPQYCRFISTHYVVRTVSREGSTGCISCIVQPYAGRRLPSSSKRSSVCPSVVFQPYCCISSTRYFSGSTQSGVVDPRRIRNIGISAHIDSGKTTLTERVLYYTGRIAEIHEVRGTDGVGAKMDSMELEREKGITIQSAATHCCWQLPSNNSLLREDPSFHINLIDTPGHVDFTIEVERALRVLDGAVLVVCGVAGIQSQTLTVDRQMKRYGVPRIIFVNKLDRDGADPFRALDGVKRKLAINACLVQLPIGLEGRHRGVVDIIEGCSLFFEGANGEVVRREASIPEGLQQKANELRMELIEALAEADEDFAELYINQGEQVSADDIHQAIRRCTIKKTFAPVLIGSAKANKGVQPLLDAVCRYLPSPCDRNQVAFDVDNPAEKIALECDPKKPLVAMAFKIQELPVGQLTYLRVYQGRLKKGDSLTNTSTQKKQVVRRLLRMHSEEAKEVGAAQAGDIVAVGGVECNSGVTLTDGATRIALENIFVPQPVLSLAVSVSKKDEQQKLAKALTRFQREDPTFKVEVNPESQETLISGMGELHLQIYLERMQREYNLVVKSGEPRVNYREALTQRGDYDYTHKKQSGGAGQFGKVIGYFEPLDTEAELHADSPNIFVNELVGNDIPPNFIASIEKGFLEAAKKGPLSGHPLINAKFVLKGGKSHEVDSSDIAFRLAAAGALRTFYESACPIILEPLMKVEVRVPLEQQTAALGLLNRRRGTVSSCVSEAENFCVEAFVPLRMMFGFVSDLRGCTQGQGEFSMEFHEYVPMQASEQDALVAKVRGEDTKKKDKKS